MNGLWLVIVAFASTLFNIPQNNLVNTDTVSENNVAILADAKLPCDKILNQGKQDYLQQKDRLEKEYTLFSKQQLTKLTANLKKTGDKNKRLQLRDDYLHTLDLAKAKKNSAENAAFQNYTSLLAACKK